MRLIHIADLHLGKTVNGFSMLQDQRYALEQLIHDATRIEADAVLIAGDIYDKSSPSAEAVALFDWLLDAVLDAGLTLLAIPGNHDSAERVAYASGPLARQGVHVPPLFDGRVQRVTLKDDHGPVEFWLLPFLKPAQVRPFLPEQDIGTDYTRALKAVLDSCPIDESRRNVLLCHQFVTAGGQQPERCDSELSIGGLDNVDASVFDRFDYVALGHIHRAQRIGRDTVRYSGSLLKYSASEADGKKTATVIDLGAKPEGGSCDMKLDALPLRPLHDMRRMKGPLSQLLDPGVAALGNADDYLHVTLTDPAPVIDALARLRTIYPNVMSLEYRRPDSKDALDGPAGKKEQAQADPEELFRRFFEEQTGATMTDAQKRLASALMKDAREEEIPMTGDAKGGKENGE